VIGESGKETTAQAEFYREQSRMNEYKPLGCGGDNKMHGQRDLLDWQDENRRGNLKERSPPKSGSKIERMGGDDAWKRGEVEGYEGEYLL